jgi:hypothetical protein
MGSARQLLRVATTGTEKEEVEVALYGVGL